MTTEQGKQPTIFLVEEDALDRVSNVGGNDWIFYLGEEPYQLRNLLRRLTNP